MTGAQPTSKRLLTEANADTTYRRKSTTSIDLCAAPYNATPGTDITTALQTAINALAAAKLSGEIYFSTVGTYLINGPQQAGTALTYAYSGQILFPAVDFTTNPSFAITIRGAVHPSSGIATTGRGSGVILQSNATTGYVFDTVPAVAMWGFQFTGIMPIFEDLIVRLPDNPQCGGINNLCALRAKYNRVQIDTTGTGFTSPLTGSLEGIVGPHVSNNGDVTFRDISIRNVPRAVRLAEHYVFEGNTEIIACNVAFATSGYSHANYLGYVDIEECLAVFEGNTNQGATVYGFLDIENKNVNFQPTQFITGNVENISGSIQLSLNGVGGMGMGYGRKMDLALIPGAVSNGYGALAGWRSTHPNDNFTRLEGAALTTGAPGQCWPSMHPWRNPGGAFRIATQQLKATTTPAWGLLPSLGTGVSRSVTATLNLPTNTGSASLIVNAPVGAANSVPSWYVEVAVNGYGSLDILVHGNDRVSLNGVVPIAQSFQLGCDLIYAQGLPRRVVARVNGAIVGRWTLTAAEIAGIAATTNVAPSVEDGIKIADTGTVCTGFVVSPLQDGAPDAGTVTLAAGTLAVANPNITAKSVVTLNRQAAGGTLGQLSVALTAGTGFTLNSSSATETSTVYYEVASY